MHLAIAADHAGFALKEKLAGFLKEEGHAVEDLGTYTPDPVDYPDVARALAEAILAKKVERGILLCGSGVGASVAANKFPGIRAAVCHDTYSAREGVEHDALNILVLGARVIGLELAKELVRAFLTAVFSGQERHRRRLDKIEQLEKSRPVIGP